MRILIVEDEYLIGMDAADGLREAGCEIVDIAPSVSKALKILTTVGCDAALIDANLDGTSAAPVAAALRERDIPFVVMTGYVSEQRDGALAEAPFLSKPFTAASLTAAVLGLIQR